MTVLIVNGAQWGDEGKGKLVDVLAAKAELVVRFHGGHNAGHTLVIGDTKIKLSLIPCGACHPQSKCLLAAGMVIEPETFAREKEMLAKLSFDVSPQKIMIDTRAHLVMPYHKDLDIAREAARGDQKIGTTGRGIGPCYEDRASRLGFQVGELRDLSKLRERLTTALAEKVALLRHYNAEHAHLTLDSMLLYLERTAALIVPHLADGVGEIQSAVRAHKRIVFEGAQAFLLDTVFGTYPYVTSSATVASAAFSSAGLAPSEEVITLGVAKAYATRVGEGPFASEAEKSEGDVLRTRGGEFGTVTGRPRRCGWIDIDLLRTATQVNGYSALAITKLDVLSGLPKVKYLYQGTLREAPGWMEDITSCKSIADLPSAAQSYVAMLEELVQVPIVVVGVGPERKQLLARSNVAGLTELFT